jgi:hypothetical protein
MEELDKRLGDCQRLENTTLGLSGLKIEPKDAIKVAAVLPKWCVKTLFTPKENGVHAMIVHAMWVRVLTLMEWAPSRRVDAASKGQLGN